MVYKFIWWNRTETGNVEIFSSNGSGEISAEQQDSPCSGMAEDYDLLATAFESIKDTNDVHSNFDMVRHIIFFKQIFKWDNQFS